MQVINEYRLNKRGSKVPAVIYLGNKWPTGKANPLTSRYLYLVLWLKWYTNHGEPRMIQHFPLLRPWSFSFILSPARMLDKCLEVCRGVFCCLFFVLFFFFNPMICMSCQELCSLWGVGEIVPFLLFFVEWGQGEGIEVLQSWNSLWVHS